MRRSCSSAQAQARGNKISNRSGVIIVAIWRKGIRLFESLSYFLFNARYLAHRAFTAAAILALDVGLMFRFFRGGLAGTVPCDSRYLAHRAFAATRPLSARLIPPFFGIPLLGTERLDSRYLAHRAFWAAAILARASALILLPGTRPRRGGRSAGVVVVGVSAVPPRMPASWDSSAAICSFKAIACFN